MENKLLTNYQYQKVIQIGQILAYMSKDKSENYWSNESLKHLELWEECRELAAEILKTYDDKLV